MLEYRNADTGCKANTTPLAGKQYDNRSFSHERPMHNNTAVDVAVLSVKKGRDARRIRLRLLAREWLDSALRKMST